jgi:hypothetical protein
MLLPLRAACHCHCWPVGPPEAVPPRNKTKNKQKAKSDRLSPFMVFLGAPCVGLCGHATVCGHPQLAVWSSFTS